MPWRDFDPRPFLVRQSLDAERTTPLQTNGTCFMRRQHRCDKVFGASKSCFVACPTDESLGPLLALLEAKLASHGIEAVVAIKERAYGQEIVCTKICGRIIECRFCIVILDETKHAGVNVANPNVYYEYGLMTALRKHVIPLQRDGMTLAFNIQHHDTVKYNPGNMAEEIERAIRDAIAETEPGQNQEGSGPVVTARGIRRRLELAGYVLAGTNAAARETTQDTQFETFISESRGYLFLAKVDDQRDVGVYLDDLPVLVYRLGELRRRTEMELRDLPETVGRTREQLAEAERGYSTRRFDLDRALQNLRDRPPILERRLRDLGGAYLGFISAPCVDSAPLRKQTQVALTRTAIRPVWNEGMSFMVGDIALDLGSGLFEAAAAQDPSV